MKYIRVYKKIISERTRGNYSFGEIRLTIDVGKTLVGREVLLIVALVPTDADAKEREKILQELEKVIKRLLQA